MIGGSSRQITSRAGLVAEPEATLAPIILIDACSIALDSLPGSFLDRSQIS